MIRQQEQQRDPDQSKKPPHKLKSREVSSRFFLPSKSSSNPIPSTTAPHGNSSPNLASSPIWAKTRNKPSSTTTKTPSFGGLGSPFWLKPSSTKVWENEQIHLGRQRSLSMRFREDLQSGQRSSPSPSSSSSSSLGLVSRRMSMNNDFGCEFSDGTSGTESGSPSMENDRRRHHYHQAAAWSPGRVPQRLSGQKVASRYLHSLIPRPHRGTRDGDQSGFAISPGRESRRREKSVSLFSGLKPPASPLKAKSLLSMGLGLFKNRKNNKSLSMSSSALLDGLEDGRESVHQLRLLHNRLLQWRYANAKAEVVKRSVDKQAEVRLLCALYSLSKLRSSVVQKKLQLDRGRLEMKLISIAQSQIKSLEAWSDLERQHLLAISMTKEYLHSVICKVPLIEGARSDLQSLSMALRHASYLAASIKSMLIAFAPLSVKTAMLLSELTGVIIMTKSMLEEFFELASSISTLEIEERSLHCALVQLRAQQKQQQELIIDSPLLDEEA